MAGGISVQTTLTVNDQLSPVLEQLVKTIANVSKALKDLGEIKAFEGLVKETRDAVKTLGGMSVMADKLTTTLGVLGGGSSRALERLAKAVGTVPGAFDQAAGGADKLGKAYAEAIGKASGLSGVVSQLQEVTKAATDALSVQKELNKSLGNARSVASHEEKRGKAIDGAAITAAGAAAGALGDHLGDGLKRVYQAGAAYQTAFAGFKALNLGEVTNEDADKFASSVNLYGVSATQVMTTLTALRQNIGDYGQAKTLTPYLAQMEFDNQAIYSGGQKFDDQEAVALAKVVGMRNGFKSKGEAQTQIDFMQHVISGSGGGIMPSQFLAFMQQGGTAATQMGNEQFYYQMAPLISALGGDGGQAGAGLAAAYQNLAIGQTTLESEKELESLGLIKKDKEGKPMIEEDASHRFLGIQAGGVEGSELIAADPIGFLMDKLVPAIKAKGFKSDDDIVKKIGTVFSDPKAANFFSQLYLQRDSIQSGIKDEGNALGIGRIDALARNTPEGAMRALSASWENFLKAVSPSLMAAAANALNFVAGGLDVLTKWAQGNQGWVTAIMVIVTGLAIFFIAIGAILVVVGTIALGVAALSMIGATVGIVVGIFSAAAAALLFIDWHAVGAWLRYGAAAVGQFLGDLGRSILRYIVDKLVAPAKAKLNEIFGTFGNIGAEILHGLLQLPMTIIQAGIGIYKAITGFGEGLQTAFFVVIGWLVSNLVSYLKSRALGALGFESDAGGGGPSLGQALAASGALQSLQFGGATTTGAGLFDWGGASPTIQGGPAPVQAMSSSGGQAVDDAKAAAAPAQPTELHIAPQTVTVNLDGQAVATAVARYEARQTGGPNTGTADYNSAYRYMPGGTQSGAYSS